MPHRSLYSIMIIAGLSALLILPLSNQAQTVVEKKLIVTPVPTATCETVEGHWEGIIWVATHNVCKYTNRTEGVAWIDNYWSCTTSDNNGNCTAWTWVPGHWVATYP